jgi:ribosomal protein S27E
MSDQKKEKLHKLFLELSLKYAPDKGEVRELLKAVETTLKKLGVSAPVWGVKLKIECPDCKYVTTVNPHQKNKIKWYCRNCGKVIVYDILG